MVVRERLKGVGELNMIKKRGKNKKGQLQISFAWIFAIIVGAVILFLAIYISTKVIKTGGEATTAKTGKEISVLLSPLETGFETSVVTLLTMPVETRIYNECSTSENFGSQIIKISQKSFEKWTETDLQTEFSNKYIFSEGVEQGKDFIIFAKPFEFPFKVSDLIYLMSKEKKYCFFQPPREIKEELSDLNQENILVEDGACPENSIKVCFGSSDDNCDINVDEFQKSVEKRGQIVYYEDDYLMYGAVFSDKSIYECQVKRLMKRTSELSKLYDEKQQLLMKQGCIPSVNLLLLANSANSLRDSRDLASVVQVSEEIGVKNYIMCFDRFTVKLW